MSERWYSKTRINCYCLGDFIYIVLSIDTQLVLECLASLDPVFEEKPAKIVGLARIFPIVTQVKLVAFIVLWQHEEHDQLDATLFCHPKDFSQDPLANPI